LVNDPSWLKKLVKEKERARKDQRTKVESIKAWSRGDFLTSLKLRTASKNGGGNNPWPEGQGPWLPKDKERLFRPKRGGPKRGGPKREGQKGEDQKREYKVKFNFYG
jgi:hypothetical protein